MPSTSYSEGQVAATLSDVASAHVLVATFETDGVPAELFANNPLLGEAQSCEVRGPASLMHRARWVLAQGKFTDAGWTFLATGELGGSDNAEQ